MRNPCSIVVVVALLASGASADLLWDNGIVPNGFSGRAISPPGFPDIRVADDFTLDRIMLQEIHLNILEDNGWIAPELITVELYEDTGGVGPGDLITTHVGTYTRVDTGDEYFGRRDYEYWVQGMNIQLDAGSYWIGARNPDGGGTGTNYWLTSDGGYDGPGTDRSWVSLDGGDTWQPQGLEWHLAFEVFGTDGGCTRDPAWQCDGDVDGDGQVNPVDAGLVQAAFGSVDEQDLCNHDMDCDGQINPVDSGIVQSLFGRVMRRAAFAHEANLTPRPQSATMHDDTTIKAAIATPAAVGLDLSINTDRMIAVQQEPEHVGYKPEPGNTMRTVTALLLPLPGAGARLPSLAAPTFSASPDFALGMPGDLTASVSLLDVDVDGDLDVLPANDRHWPSRVFSPVRCRCHIRSCGAFNSVLVRRVFVRAKW